MSHVAMFTLAGDVGGQWEYESALLDAFKRVPRSISVQRVRVRNMRSTLPGEMRLPVERLAALPGTLQRHVAGHALRRFDLVHRCDLRLPSAPREVLTIHDTAWVHDSAAPAPSAASLRTIRRARAVIAPSRFAADEIAQHLDRTDVAVAMNGVDEETFRAVPLEPDQLRRIGLDRPFLLCSGGNAPRKNVPALIDAWQRIGARTHVLAITGMGAAAVKTPGVIPLGHMPRPEFLGVLAAADAIVVPSVYEGFGLPALEGMAAGKPVLATNCASLPEVCGDAALLADPDAASLADGITAILSDETLRTNLVSRGHAQAQRFTWRRSAEIHMTVYEAALALDD